MYKFYSVFDIKAQWKKGRIVIVEFMSNKRPKRAVVNHVSKNSENVETYHGLVFPNVLYSFNDAVEAQKFIYEIERNSKTTN